MVEGELEADPKAQQAALDSLEDAAGKGDVAKTCSLLNILRQQYTEQPRNQWSTDTVASLWDRVLETMRVMQTPEVGGLPGKQQRMKFLRASGPSGAADGSQWPERGARGGR